MTVTNDLLGYDSIQAKRNRQMIASKANINGYIEQEQLIAHLPIGETSTRLRYGNLPYVGQNRRFNPTILDILDLTSY